jgi:hypothetical protein
LFKKYAVTTKSVSKFFVAKEFFQWVYLMNKCLDKVGGHIHKAGGNALLPEYVPHQNTKTKT